MLEGLAIYPEIAQAVQTLRQEKNSMLPELAFLRATINNADVEKISDSYSGNIVDCFHLWAARMLVLSICRIFDGNPPLILKVLDQISQKELEIVTARKEKYPAWSDENLGIDKLGIRMGEEIKTARNLYESRAFAEIRVYRTERLAHRFDACSRDREKFFFEGEANPPLSSIVGLSSEIVRTIDSIISFWEFHIENSMDALKNREAYGRMFWRAIPRLGDVEDVRFFNSD